MKSLSARSLALSFCDEPRWPMLGTDRGVSDWIVRVRSEYLESPGLALTKAQAMRLWTMDADTCSAVLDALIEDGFLCATKEGRFIRPGVAR